MHTDQKEVKQIRKIPLVSLVGQPNSGKTTIFNFLSGKNFKTVNYPGSTVEYSVSKILSKYSIDAHILDSPGIISLVPSSPEEKLSVQSLMSHSEFGGPEVVVVTVDCSQLARHLLLVEQLKRAGFHVIIALTMHDMLLKKGLDLSPKRLSEMIKCPAVFVNGKTGEGINDLLLEIRQGISSLEPLPKQSESGISYGKTKEDLLALYRGIESIEKEVVFTRSTHQTDGFSVQSVNEKLIVLGNQPNSNKPDAFTLKLDTVLLHRFWGIVIFAGIMTLTFASIFWLASPLMDLVNEAFSIAGESVSGILGDTWYGNLLSNGIISGVGSVMVFLPQILILFFILGLLENSGYLARGAMIIDKPLSIIGLNGKSFVPMLSGFACAIPAIMATRTIASKKERFLTIFILPLMSCSARLPVYALLIAFLIPSDEPFLGGLILTGIYLFSIASSLAIASIAGRFSKTFRESAGKSSFILELPAYRTPHLGIVSSNALKSAMEYVKKAGPVILYLSIALWILTYFPNTDPEVDTAGRSEEEVAELVISERISTSYASYAGQFIEPVLRPLGLDWRVGVSLIATLAAREVFVSSLALIFKITDTGEDIQSSLLNAMRQATVDSTGEKVFTVATSAGLIIFFVFALQCISTIAIVRKETGSWRMPMFQLISFTGLAYVLAFITVNGLRMIGIN